MGGSLTMKNGKIDKFLFGGGYAQASVASSTTDNFAFYYYNQDHLGNIREVVDASGTVKQVTNYYPFGAPYADIPAGSTNPDFQPYKYNGKELDKMQGLNTYDYGARQHDPILARWDRIDPLCEKYYSISPYAHCGNSPIKNIDPDGKEVRDGLGSYNKDNGNQKALVQYLAKHNDSNSIMIVAHGVMQGNEKYASSINIQTYNLKTEEWSDNYISNGKELGDFLSKNSKVWNNYKAGKIDAEDLHIVFYSCSSSEVVKKISSDSEFKDVTFIAPTKDIGVTAKGEVIVSDLKRNSKGNLVVDNSPGKGPGNWNTIRNGKYSAFSQYPGNRNLKPGTAKFKYK